MHLFTYGTLEVVAIMAAVTGAEYPSEPAVLDGFARFLLRDRPYPGIVAVAGAATGGTLYLGVDAPGLALLDEFEDECYERRLVRVRKAGGEMVTACAYVIPDHSRHLVSTEPWDLEAFLASNGIEFRRHWDRLRGSRPAVGRVREMTFVDLPDQRGLLYVPDRQPGRGRHDCPDCHACQQCSNDRCARCRGGENSRPRPESPPIGEEPSPGG